MKDFLTIMEKDYRKENFTLQEFALSQFLVVAGFASLFVAIYVLRCIIF